MNFQEDINFITKQWIKKAEADLLTVKHELSFFDEEIIVETVCFHSQQAIEKYLKAFLVFKQKEFSKTHDLEELRKLCKEIDKSFSNLEFKNLTDFAVVCRYPDDFLNPTLEEAKEAYDLALSAKEFIISKINL